MRNSCWGQLEIPRSLARDHHLPAVTAQNVLWAPSHHVVTVRADAAVWTADWPDEEAHPLPETTAAWLLWHIEWWWNDVLRGARGLLASLGTNGRPRTTGSCGGPRWRRAPQPGTGSGRS